MTHPQQKAGAVRNYQRAFARPGSSPYVLRRKLESGANFLIISLRSSSVEVTGAL